MNTKKCSKCQEIKDISEYIKKCGMCRPCRTIHRKEYRIKNKEKFKQKDHQYYSKYREKIRKQQTKYYEKNSQNIQEQRKEKRIENPEKYRNIQRMRYQNNLNHRLSLVYRNRVRREISSGKKYLQYLGCSIDDLKKWFEFNFELDEFEWSTYGKQWEIDHVIPCCKFNMQKEEEIYSCFNWKNTKPATVSLNKSKNSKILKWQILEQEIRLKLFEKANQLMTTALYKKL